MRDIKATSNIIIGQIIEICRTENVFREEEMTNMIDMLCDAHVTSVGTLVGACLITAKQRKLRGEDHKELDAVVLDLVEKSDADFSLRLRSKVLGFIKENDTPNPFEHKGA